MKTPNPRNFLSRVNFLPRILTEGLSERNSPLNKLSRFISNRIIIDMGSRRDFEFETSGVFASSRKHQLVQWVFPEEHAGDWTLHHR